LVASDTKSSAHRLRHAAEHEQYRWRLGRRRYL